MMYTKSGESRVRLRSRQTELDMDKQVACEWQGTVVRDMAQQTGHGCGIQVSICQQLYDTVPYL